jgi:hypothetical protein
MGRRFSFPANPKTELAVISEERFEWFFLVYWEAKN